MENKAENDALKSNLILKKLENKNNINIEMIIIRCDYKRNHIVKPFIKSIITWIIQLTCRLSLFASAEKVQNQC